MLVHCSLFNAEEAKFKRKKFGKILFEKSKVLRSCLGNELVESYAKLKHQDWRNYSAAISQWERDHTLDC